MSRWPSRQSRSGSRNHRATAPRLAATLLAAAVAGIPGPAPATPTYVTGDYLFILTREMPGYAGACALMDCHAPWEHDDNYRVLHYDAVARFYDGLIYVVNRMDGDNIQVLDPQDDFATVRQFSVGIGANPQEIAFVHPERAFVTRYDAAELWEVNPQTGERTDTIDLSPLADGDGIPEMHGMAIHGGYLYVTVQRWNRDGLYWTLVPPSYLAVIDLTDNTLCDMAPATPGMQGIALAAPNPNGGIRRDPLSGDFLIAETGEYGLFEGGLERFDPDTRQSRGWVVTEATLNADLGPWATGDGQTGFLICMGPPPESLTELRAIDLGNGTPLATLIASSEYAYEDLHVDQVRGQLFVSDHSYANPGIRVFHTVTFAELTSGPVPVGLYPFRLLGVPGAASTAPEPNPKPRETVLRVQPQPAARKALLSLQLTCNERVRLDILDLSGRSVRTLSAGPQPAGICTWLWDGTTRHGEPVPSGCYWVRVRIGGRQLVRPVRLLR